MSKGPSRAKQWMVVGVLLMVTSGAVATASAEGVRGWPADFPGSFWSRATWQEATPAERRTYILGITDGLRLAAGFDRAEVDLGPVAQCVEGMSADRLASVVASHLDARSIEGDELTLHFHVWDALVSTCLDRPRSRG